MKVLVVDDSRITRALIIKLLAPYEKYEVFEASSGEEALSLLKKRRDIRIVLLDYNMPEMNGLVTLSEIRKVKHLKDIPVIMVTVEGGKNMVLKAMQLGANDYIVKPIDGATLFWKIEKYTNPHELQK